MFETLDKFHLQKKTVRNCLLSQAYMWELQNCTVSRQGSALHSGCALNQLPNNSNFRDQAKREVEETYAYTVCPH